ncbi:Cystathionine beta-synthase family protein isoform 1 [Dorcoceras hygrometricum]|uniref:Cystathionine beta-synthase family protein isoform 1 n=1 Tax=Dorcoceras hygrometricum TaxID=472368 RepID=A0A2Z6ZX95_9LAMI|nr:Cystathionine beta-synthase family protein isoform 1 [Dorcoceras hygrometricum]
MRGAIACHRALSCVDVRRTAPDQRAGQRRLLPQRRMMSRAWLCVEQRHRARNRCMRRRPPSCMEHRPDARPARNSSASSSAQLRTNLGRSCATIERGVTVTSRQPCATTLVYSIAMVYANSNGNSDSLYQQKGQYTFATVLFLGTVQATFTIDSFRKQLVQHDIVGFNGFDDVSRSRHHDVIIIISYNAPNRYDDVSSTKVCKWKDLMTSSVLKLAELLNLVYRDKSLDSKELFIRLLQGKICR